MAHLTRSLATIALATALAACASAKSPIDCPDGTSYRKVKLGGRATAVCVNGDQKIHGPTLAWQEVEGAEKKAFEGSYDQGVPHGVFKQWSPSGELLGSYEMDKGSGTLVEWHPNGTKSLEVAYQEGTRTGRLTAWHNNGTKSEEGGYAAGAKQGKWASWDAEGKETLVEQYDKGKLIDNEGQTAEQ